MFVPYFEVFRDREISIFTIGMYQVFFPYQRIKTRENLRNMC